MKYLFYIGFVYLILAVSYFGLNDFKNASKQLTKLYMLDSYASLDKAFRLKISIFELIVRYELTDFDFILMRLKQIQSDFKPLLAEEAFAKEKQMLVFLKLIIANTGSLKKGKLFEDIKYFVGEYKGSEQDDSEIINYADWLIQKIK